MPLKIIIPVLFEKSLECCFSSLKHAYPDFGAYLSFKENLINGI